MLSFSQNFLIFLGQTHYIGTIVPIQQGLVIRSLLELYLLSIVARLSILNELIYYYVMCQCMSTFVHVDVTVQFTFFLVTKLNITIITSWDSLMIILVPQFLNISSLVPMRLEPSTKDVSEYINSVFKFKNRIN